MKRYNVYYQAAPVATGERSTTIDRNTGRALTVEWHRANLQKVGESDSMEEAKELCSAPVLEAAT